MNLANDERIRKLNDQIQTEKNPARLTALVEELTRLLDELNPRMCQRLPSVTSMPTDAESPD